MCGGGGGGGLEGEGGGCVHCCDCKTDRALTVSAMINIMKKTGTLAKLGKFCMTSEAFQVHANLASMCVCGGGL